MKKIAIVCAFILLGCKMMPKDSKVVYRNSKQVRRNDVVKSYLRIHGAASSNINLRSGNFFDRWDRVYMYSIYYSGTYTISDSMIIFQYTKNFRPAELKKAKINDTILTTSYLMKYKKEDYIGKDGKPLNGVDTTLWNRVDTIKRVYKIIR